MKANNKYLFFVAGAFIALSACQQDESLTQRPQGDASVITFNSPYTVDSRSDAMRSGSFKTGDKVGVLGYCIASNSQGVDYSASPWDTKKPFCTPDVFYNQELTYSGTGSWDYSWGSDEATGAWADYDPVGDLHPWATDEEYTYSFFAYYPYAEVDNRGVGTIKIKDENDKEIEMGEIELSTSNHRGDPTITYTMPHGNGANLSFTHDWFAVPDFMLAYKTDHLKRDGSVKLDFRHLFCAFEFRVNNYNEYPVTISDLYISGGTETNPRTGFYKSVTVTGQESGYTVGNEVYIGRFKLIEGKTSGGFECPAGTRDENGQIVPSVTNVLSREEGHRDEVISLLFIPDENGKLTSDGNESLNLTLQATSSDGELNQTKNMNLKESVFQPGVRSIFNINIIGNDFYIQVRSDGSWSDGGDSDIVFE